MEWVKLSTSYDHDDAIMRAGEAAEVLFTRALAYCGRDETGGFVADGMPGRLCPRGTAARVRALVAEKLWVRDDLRRGWWIRSWESWQSELDALAERRRADRERKRRERERRAREAKSSRDTSRDGHGTADPQSLVTERSQPVQNPNEIEASFSQGETDTPTPLPADIDSTSRDSHVTVRASLPRAIANKSSEGREELSTRASHTSLGRNARELGEPPPSDAAPTVIERLMTEHRDNSRRVVSSKVAEKLAEEAHRLLRDGFTEEEIRRGMAQLRLRSLGPGVLPMVVDEIANAPEPGNVIELRGHRSGRPFVDRPPITDVRVANALALGDLFPDDPQESR